VTRPDAPIDQILLVSGWFPSRLRMHRLPSASMFCVPAVTEHQVRKIRQGLGPREKKKQKQNRSASFQGFGNDRVRRVAQYCWGPLNDLARWRQCPLQQQQQQQLQQNRLEKGPRKRKDSCFFGAPCCLRSNPWNESKPQIASFRGN